MNKIAILSFIQKYSLGGSVESVTWEITAKGAKTRMISDDKSMLGEVTMISNKFSDEMTGKKLGVFRTSEFVKLLGVVDDTVDVSLTMVGDKAISIKVSDKHDEINYALADLAVVPAAPPIKYVPKNFEVKLKINDAFVNRFSKAKGALPNVVQFAVLATNKDVTILLGQTDVNTSTVKLQPEVIETAQIEKLNFNADVFRDILNANKGVDAEFLISSEGLAKLEFTSDDYTATYFLVAKTSN